LALTGEKNEKNISTIKKKAVKRARFQEKNVIKRRQKGTFKQKEKGKETSYCFWMKH
jgi:hypothetical protein